MLRIITTLTLVFASLSSFSQTRYYPPNFYCQFLLDSLDIPYLPINRRVSLNGFSESYKQRFIQMFGNDLSFFPKTSDTDVPIELFVFNKELASERDLTFHQLMAGFDYDVISTAIVPVNGNLHKSIWIVEIYGKATDQFNVIMYFENHDGKFQTIFEDYLPFDSKKLLEIDYE